MYLKVKKTLRLQGNATLPSSKSQSIRGMLFALLAEGESTLHNLLISDDTKTAINVCQALGANIHLNSRTLTIKSKGLPLTNTIHEINTGNSGITTLFTLPLLGLRENHSTPIILNCDLQMKERPIKSLIEALRTLGMKITHLEQDDRLPVSITGQLKGGIAEVDGTTSQYLSSLLIGLPCAKNDSVITVKNLNERPYVNMTLDWLKAHNINLIHEHSNNIDIFYIRGKQKYKALNTAINGDYSSASCLIAAAVLHTGEIELHGLNKNDVQGDKELIPILRKMGADIHIDDTSIRIRGNHPLKGIRIDAKDIPDLVPALSVLATQATGKTEIYNVKQARIKETDRIHSMTNGLRQMGARIEASDDCITVYQSELTGNFVNGYEDHRTVMALTVAGMIANGSTTISNGFAINKTFPEFVNTMQSLGANVTFYDNLAENHIILIGFKHVGKTQIGLNLAKKLNKKFIDLDNEIEKIYERSNGELLSCHQIMKLNGVEKFRKLESQALEETLKQESSVISLGGGTVLNPKNQELIINHNLIHIIASRGIVFERIMVEGRPAFFNSNEDPYESFIHLWEERDAIYRKLTPHRIDNSGSLDQAVNHVISLINNLKST